MCWGENLLLREWHLLFKKCHPPCSQGCIFSQLYVMLVIKGHLLSSLSHQPLTINSTSVWECAAGAGLFSQGLALQSLKLTKVLLLTLKDADIWKISFVKWCWWLKRQWHLLVLPVLAELHVYVVFVYSQCKLWKLLTVFSWKVGQNF